MGYFDSQFITDDGSALLAKSTAGEGNIIFTAIHTGDGDYNMQEISRITSSKALKNEKQVFFVNDIDCREKDTRIRTVITNHELTEGYYIREAGLYARMEDEEEILFSISICVEKPTFLPAMGDVPIEMPITNHITYSGDGNFTIEFRSDVYASLEMVERIFDGLKKDIQDNKSELNTHVNNSAIHFTKTERDKLSGIAAEANKYTHPVSAAGAKTSGLYKITTDANGHVTGATAVVKKDITDLGIPASDTNTTYGTGTASAAGLTKLYTSTGQSTDGTMTQKAITNYFTSKIKRVQVAGIEIYGTSINIINGDVVEWGTSYIGNIIVRDQYWGYFSLPFNITAVKNAGINTNIVCQTYKDGNMVTYAFPFTSVIVNDNCVKLTLQSGSSSGYYCSGANYIKIVP